MAVEVLGEARGPSYLRKFVTCHVSWNDARNSLQN